MECVLPFLCALLLLVLIIYNTRESFEVPPIPPQTQWMTIANTLCAPRVSAECRGLDYIDRIACVQQGMNDCMNKNAQNISTNCMQQTCSIDCMNGIGPKCQYCLAKAQLEGICAKPDLN